MPELANGSRIRFRSPQSGPVHLAVVRGPSGVDGATGVGVEIHQNSPSASWVLAVPGSFGRTPNVALYDTDGVQIEADVTATPSNVNVQFPTPIAGSAVLS